MVCPLFVEDGFEKKAAESLAWEIERSCIYKTGGIVMVPAYHNPSLHANQSKRVGLLQIGGKNAPVG
jgi:hypothetical protein